MTDLIGALREANSALRRGDPNAAFGAIRAVLRREVLSVLAIASIDRVLGAICNHPDAGDIQVKRVAILAGALSTPMLARAIRVALAAEGVVARIQEGEYNGYQLEIIDPASALYSFQPDLVVLALGWRDIVGIDAPFVQEGQAQALVESEGERFAGLWETLQSRLGVPVMQHLFDRDNLQILGVADRRSSGGSWSLIDSLNRHLLAIAPPSVSWIDLDAASMRFGLAAWHSPRDYYSAKLPFSSAALPDYVTTVRGVFRALKARPLKALVIDLDNTLWGGVIGDDGVDGTTFGMGDAVGEAFLAFAHYLKALSARGVILAVSSKNDPELPRRMFTGHYRGMPLTTDDFAAFRCNWEDKPTNLRGIADELNIGVDAIAFADDNPAECEIVRRELPQVTVVQLDMEPWGFVSHLDSLRLFDQQAFTQDDQLRAASYQAMRVINGASKSATDVSSFLRDLDMKADCGRAVAGDLTRLAQMELKTNQFNTTTRRYTQDALQKSIKDPNSVLLSFRLRDRLADHGLVGSLLAVKEDGCLRIDSWLLSCRAFSRTVEQYMMRELIGEARHMGVDAIVGEYLPTERNRVVADLYERLGFSSEPTAAGRYRLYLDTMPDSALETFIQSADTNVERMSQASS